MVHTTLNEAELKKFLQEVQENKYERPMEMTEYEAVKLAVQALASTDGELRDELAYNTLWHWLLEKKFLTPHELKEVIYEAVSDKMLLFNIGEEEGDRVFLRTFSSLLIVLILTRDNQDCFLEPTDIRYIAKRIILYCEKERDFRGFVEGKGWAHSAAHISDVIDELAQNRYIESSECEEFWEGLMSLLNNAQHVFDAQEDERMVTAVVTMIAKKKVTVNTICTWLKVQGQPVDHLVSSYTRKINSKHFIRSLYFRLKHKESDEAVEGLLEIEEQWNTFLK